MLTMWRRQVYKILGDVVWKEINETTREKKEGNEARGRGGLLWFSTGMGMFPLELDEVLLVVGRGSND